MLCIWRCADAKQIEGVSERILACTKSEFLGDAMTEKVLHIVTTSRFESLCEVIRHGMSREEAAKYIDLLSRYHRTGFFAVFGPEQ